MLILWVYSSGYCSSECSSSECCSSGYHSSKYCSLSTVPLSAVPLGTVPLDTIPLSTVPGRGRLPQCAIHRLRASPQALWPPLQMSNTQHTHESFPWVISLVPQPSSPKPLLQPLHPAPTSNCATDPRKGCQPFSAPTSSSAR